MEQKNFMLTVVLLMWPISTMTVGWIFLVTGYHDEYKSITKLYKNNGNDTFTEDTGIDFVGHQQGELLSSM